VPDEVEQRRDGGRTRADDPGALSRLLQEIALAPADDVVAAWKEQLRPGARVGRFEIRAEIGRGGFGSVYEAFDPELGRVADCPDLAYARTLDGSRVSPNLNFGRATAYQVPVSARFGVMLSF